MRIKEWFILILIMGTLFYCRTKQNTMTFESVKNGHHLEQVPLVSLEEFFQLWLRNRKHPKMVGINFEKLFEDKEFQYFGKKELDRLLPISNSRFFKIQKEILNKEFPGYESIFSDELQGYFQNRVLPESDWNFYRETKTANRENCIPFYQLSLMDKKIILMMKWDVEDCKELVSLKDKTYRLVYDLRKKQFEE
ncbi:hypothetical protein [Leptospira alstonii]|nr:hypothetical protein LEP1GSC194_1684 [Leptospira alstonii serovar Sichuan str. 79601]